MHYRSPAPGLFHSRVSRNVTTVLTAGWGYYFISAFFRDITGHTNLFVCITALFPICAVWASLGRKRWGRMTLIVASALALTLFALMIVQNRLPTIGDRYSVGPASYDCLVYVVQIFGETPIDIAGGLVLALCTVAWFSTPLVRQEYEKTKKTELEVGQQIISGFIVLSWMTAAIVSPPMHHAGHSHNPPTVSIQTLFRI